MARERTAAPGRPPDADPDAGAEPARPHPSRVLRTQDLTQLPVLRALLHERNVTRAGETLGLSQPATSAILGRLRRRFDDELLVRVGREFELTPFATSLLQRLDEAVDAVERVFGDEFDPGTTTRDFSLVVSDYFVTVAAQRLGAIMQEEAPGAVLDLRQLTATVLHDLDATMRHTDGILVPHELIQGHPGQVLVTDRWVCVVAESNATVGDELTLDDLARLPWVTQYDRLDPTGMPAMRQLRAIGIEPKIDVLTEGFQAVPFLVAGTDRVAFLHQRLAQLFRPIVAIRVLPNPVEVSDVRLAMRWQAALNDDPGHLWFRSVIARATAHLR